MSNPIRPEIPDLLALRPQAGGIRLHARRIGAPMSGGHVSTFRGRGMEFAEVRGYQPGDDSRDVDWRATARRGKPYTKLYREERERPVLLWVDLRAAQFFATKGCYKAVMASRLATLAAWAAHAQGDRIGGLVFCEREHREIKPRRGKAAMLHFINQLVTHPAWDRGYTTAIEEADRALTAALERLLRVALPGSLIVLASDFHGLRPEHEALLAQIGRHCDLVFLVTHDPIELEPPAGRFWFDLGHGHERALDTGNDTVRTRWKARFAAHFEQIENLGRRRKARVLRCATNADPAALLTRGL
ncbi:MAG: DUF58 domain-containing protein [Gammaproteobacteria bacterium]|nr:DUF58 domain-containing protein [Gammaproteobacteria bacterium]